MPVILSIIADIKAESVITNDVEGAAKSIFRQRRDDCLEVLEIIGSWPASDNVLRALQQVDVRS